MVIAVASSKGGVGKTTTAVHLAAYLQKFGSTLLLDGDDTRNATTWGRTSEAGFPFEVADEKKAAILAPRFEHIVIDTGQRPSEAELAEMVGGCHLLVIPAVPAALDNSGLLLTLMALKRLKASSYRVLLTKVPPAPENDGEMLRTLLEEQQCPIFPIGIPRLKAFPKAAAAGITVDQLKDDRADRAWAAYQQLGKEVLAYGNAKL